MSPVPPATSTSRHGRPRFGGLSALTMALFHTPVHAARHQVVHQVVAARDAGEDVVDHRLLVFKRDALEAEGNALTHGPAAICCYEARATIKERPLPRH